MHPEEEHEQVLVGQHRRIERDLDRLGVTGTSLLHLVVRGVLDRAAGVADLGVDHAGDLANDVFHAPEAPTGEGGGLDVSARHACLRFVLAEQDQEVSSYPLAVNWSAGTKASDAELMQ